MKKMTRRTWLAAAGMTSVAVRFAGSVLADDKTQNNPRHFQDIPPRELIQRRHLPNVELVTHEGKKVHFYDDMVKDKIVAINFMYSHCEKICPPIMANLARVQKILVERMGRDIFMYSISLKPEEDTPEVLNKYAKAIGVRPGWLLLTGKPEDVEFLRKSLGFTYRDPKEDADKSNHIGMLRIGNEPMMRWAACEGQARAEWIATVIRNEADDPLKGGLKQESTASVE
jgi:protein SCO1/2